MDLIYADSDGNSIEVEKHVVIDNEVVGCDKTKEPCVGMTFDSFEEAKDFYEDYGRQKGFNIRTRSTYRDRRGPEVTSALFVCSCEGFNQKIPKNDDEGKIKRSSSTLRSGCKACMRITNIKGTTIWRITVFSDKHNHKLLVLGKTDNIKCNRRRLRVTKNLTEGMRINHICRRLTQLAYMAGRSEEIYKVVMADMDETFQKVSLMDRESHKYENDEKPPNEASTGLKNPSNAPPAEEVGSNNQTLVLDALALQAKGRKRMEKGKEKVGGTGKSKNELEIEMSVASKTPQPAKIAKLEGYFSDGNNCACKKMKPDNSKPDITHNIMQTIGC